MRIIGNDQKNDGQNFWEILERIIGKISSIIGAGLAAYQLRFLALAVNKCMGMALVTKCIPSYS